MLTPQDKGSVSQDCPHSDASHKSHVATCSSDQLSLSLRGSYNFLFRFDNLFEQLSELKKMLYLLLLLLTIMVYYKGLNLGTAKWKKGIGHSMWGREMELPQPLQVCCLSTALMCSSTQKLSEPNHLGVFMEFSLYRHN